MAIYSGVSTSYAPLMCSAEVTRRRLVHFLRDGVMMANCAWNRKRKRAAVDDIQDEDEMDADRKALRNALSEDEQYLLSHTMSPAGLTEYCASAVDVQLRTVPERMRLGMYGLIALIFSV